MPKWIKSNNKYLGKYDVVHVDGGHSEHCISNDLKNTHLLVKNGGIVIIDDTNVAHINYHVDKYISTGQYKELNILKTHGYPHRIIQKIKINQVYLNTKYSWQNDTIIFLDNGKMNAFGQGTYTQQDTYKYQANFGGRIHDLIFNDDYTKFISTRQDDNLIVKCKLIL
jgi:hypothetical protein